MSGDGREGDIVEGRFSCGRRLRLKVDLMMPCPGGRTYIGGRWVDWTPDSQYGWGAWGYLDEVEKVLADDRGEA